MQTRTYGELFKLIKSLSGVGQFATSELDDVANFINRRFLQIFNESPIWPRYFVPSEKRDILSLTLSGATTSTDITVNQNYKLLGANTSGGSNVYQGATTSSVIVYNTGTAWRVDTEASVQEVSGTFTVTSGTEQFIEADLNKKQDITDVVTFTGRDASTDVLLVEGKNLIPFAQTGRTTIGSFSRIFRKQAFLNRSTTEYEFFVNATGANILNVVSNSDNSAFVTYKQEFTPFNVTSNYETSDVKVPAEFFAYIAHTAYADFLRMDGQTDKAFAEEKTASLALALELEKIDIISNNNTVNKRFSTYVNRQSR